MLAWGYNRYGQVGDATTTHATEPVRLELPSGSAAAAVGAGNYHGLAVTRGPSSTTSVTADPRETTVGHEVTFTAGVTCSTGAVAQGEVRFVNTHGRLLGTAALVDGVATLTVSDLAEGEHTVVAEYVGHPRSRGTTGSATAAARVAADRPDRGGRWRRRLGRRHGPRWRTGARHGPRGRV